MKRLRTFSADRVALAGTVVLLLIAAAWVGWGERVVARVAHPPPALAGEATATTIVAVEEAAHAEAATEAWPTPDSSAGWGFDLFTPPVIYYDRATGRFTVSPAQAETAKPDVVAESRFGLSLLDVERQRFPLQLVGYAGEPGNYLGIFQNEQTGDGVVARTGHRFADLGLDLRSLDVRREDTIVPDSMPLREMVAVAEVWDAAAERLVRLSSAGWQWTDAPVAHMRLELTGEVRALRAGERWEAEGAAFEIRSVAALPARVLVLKHHNDGTREEMSLWPESAAENQPEGDSPFPAIQPR